MTIKEELELLLVKTSDSSKLNLIPRLHSLYSLKTQTLKRKDM